MSGKESNGAVLAAADDVRKPVKNNSESPGRKKPTSRPDSAKMIAVTTASAAPPA